MTPTCNIKNNIWKMYTYKFFVSLSLVSAILVPFFTEWGGISFSQIMFLQSWFILWIFLLEIPTGVIADYFGRKYSLILCSFFYLLSAIIFANYPDFYVFLVAEFLSALAFALYSGADEALIYDSLKEINREKDSKKIFGRAGSFNLGGIMIGSLIGGIIASEFGLRVPMLLMIIPATINIFIAISLKEPTKHKESKTRSYSSILKDGIKFFYKHRVLKIIALDMTIISSVAYFIIWFFQEGLKRSELDLIYFGIIQAIFIGIQVVVMNNFEGCEKIFKSKKKYLLFSGLILGIAFIVAGMFINNTIIIIACMLLSGFGLSRKQLMSSYINKHTPSEQRATVLSVISMFGKFTLIIVTPIVGFMVDWSLNYTLIIFGTIAIVFSLITTIKEEYLID